MQEDLTYQDEIISSAEDISDFMKSSLYKDFLTVINTGIGCLTVYLRDTSQQYTLRDYDLLRGGIKNLEEMKELYPQLLEIKLLERENK